MAKIDKLTKLRNQLSHLEARREAAIKTLVKAEGLLPVLRKRVQRLTARQLERQAKPTLKETVAKVEVEVAKQLADDLDIPTFLKRGPREEFNPYEAQQKERKAIKSRARIDKMKAKQRGDLAKMPLTGKAALDAIKNG